MQHLSGDHQLPAGKVLCLLALYFLAHVAVRVAISDSLELDEAEQLVLGQSFTWGYGTKPPLYSWLQIGFFRLCGESVLALSLLKNLLLFVTYLCTFLAFKKVANRAGPALIAALSLLLIPQISWESQRDLTHSVLATTIAASTLVVFLVLCETRKTSLYLAFGTIAGLGFLAKFNATILSAALLLAALSLPMLRPVILERRSLFSLAAFFAVTGGYLAWFATNSTVALAQTGTFRMKTALPYWQSLIIGNFNLFKSTLAFAGTAFIILLVVFWTTRKTVFAEGDSGNRLYWQLLGRTLLISLLIMELGVLIFRITHFKDRWLQPIIFFAPAWFSMLLASNAGKAASRAFGAICLAISLTVLSLIPARPLLAAYFDTFVEFNVPYDLFAEQLRQRGFSKSLILAEDGLVAGNLRLQLPDSTALAVGLPRPLLTPTESCLLAWDATKTSPPPASLLQLAEQLSISIAHTQPEFLEAPYHYANSPQQKARLGIIPCKPPMALSSTAKRL